MSKNPKDPFDPIEYPSDRPMCDHGVYNKADCFMCLEEDKAKVEAEAQRKKKEAEANGNLE